jgi:hypothetical protein
MILGTAQNLQRSACAVPGQSNTMHCRKLAQAGQALAISFLLWRACLMECSSYLRHLALSSEDHLQHFSKETDQVLRVTAKF